MPQISTPTGRITELLLAWGDGDRDAQQELLPLVYDHLRRIAHNHLRRERPGHTLETGGLVHEAYLKLVEQERMSWRNRAQFFALSSRLMRRILVDHARERAAQKRGGDVVRVPLDDADPAGAEKPPDLLAVDEALDLLAATDAEAARLVELRYFGGLTKEEIAEVMDISTATVSRRWRVIRAWLYGFLVRGERLEL
jgi:RNA polymerase sigma factor (TIGR02999 family)